MTEPSLSPLHRIIGALGGALDELGARATLPEVERWGIALHEALSSRTREFHTPWHVLELLPGADPAAVVATLYHDVIYVQVDVGLPAGMDDLLRPLLRPEEKGWRILEGADRDAIVGDVLAVFGRRTGDLLTPFTGLNELASALVATRTLAPALARVQVVAMAACIEQSIPFRENAPEVLAARLAGLGLDAATVHDMVVRAVRVGNRDIGNFAIPDTARFLDHTWRLLPESNPALHAPTLYTVREYRVALMKMEEFLATLRAEHVFHAWGGEPDPDEHRRRVETARRNIAMAVRYLRAKLFSIGVLEALAAETGGDAPLEFFMGGRAEPGSPPYARIETWLEPPAPHADVDPELLRLLESGRTIESGFDTATSPLGAYLYRALGEAGGTAGLAKARTFWAGALGAYPFLSSLGGAHVAALARAASHIATTRQVQLAALGDQLARGGAGAA